MSGRAPTDRCKGRRGLGQKRNSHHPAKTLTYPPAPAPQACRRQCPLLPSRPGGQREWPCRGAAHRKEVQDAGPARQAKALPKSPGGRCSAPRTVSRERDRWSSGRQSAAEGRRAKRWLEEDHRFLSPSTRNQRAVTPPRPWHFLYFFPDPQGQASFRPGSLVAVTGARTRSPSPRFVTTPRGSCGEGTPPTEPRGTPPPGAPPVRVLLAMPRSSTWPPLPLV